MGLTLWTRYLNTVSANVNPTELSTSGRIARKILKLLALPMIILAGIVKFTIPPSTWWIDGVFIGLCLAVVALLIIGRVPIHGKVAPNDSEKKHADNS